MNKILNYFIVPNNAERMESLQISCLGHLMSLKCIDDCMTSCPNITKLGICLNEHSSSICFPLKEILSRISSFGRNLESISLRGSSVNDSCLTSINNENFPSLVNLSIVRSGVVSSKGIARVVSKCPKLTSLSLYYSIRRDTDRAAVSIGKYLPELKSINMYRCLKLTDEGLSVIVRGCKNLETIEVGRNYELTDQSLREIASNCTNLKSLGMAHNDKISTEGLEYVTNACRNLTEIRTAL